MIFYFAPLTLVGARHKENTNGFTGSRAATQHE